MKQMRIGWLFPDTLYLHGERGNVLALQRFAQLGGYEPVTEKIDFDTASFDPMDYDILFCPPGELASFPTVLEVLQPLRAQLEAFVDAGRPLLATGTATALWCRSVRRTDGSGFDGLDLIDAEAVEKESVYGDDVYFSCTYNGREMEIIGNQIQMIDLIAAADAPVFGRLLYGYGNTGTDRNEGFLRAASIFTNTLGPMLVTNPWLTMEMIRAAAAAKGDPMPEFTFDDQLERASFATKRAFLTGKETRLTNTK